MPFGSTKVVAGKDKSLKVPFHRLTLSYSYYEEFEFLCQFSKKQNMTKKKYQNRNEKFVDKAKSQQYFAFLHIRPKLAQKFKFLKIALWQSGSIETELQETHLNLKKRSLKTTLVCLRYFLQLMYFTCLPQFKMSAGLLPKKLVKQTSHG